MGSNLKLENADGTVFTLEHRDGSPAGSIYLDEMTKTVYSQAELEAYVATEGRAVIWNDADKGGIFIHNGTATSNGLTIFNGWSLQGDLTVDSVDDLVDVTAADNDRVAIVRDIDHGGIFIYDSTRVADSNGGTVFNGWVRQYEGPVNVKWFGANGTCVYDEASKTVSGTDSSIPIQKALDYAKAVGGEVYIPAGTYKATGLNFKVRVFGDSRELTTIADSGDVQDSTLLTGGDERYSHLFRVTLRGYAGKTKTLLYYNFTRWGIRIEDCRLGDADSLDEIQEAKYGMHFSDENYYKEVRNCIIRNCYHAVWSESSGNTLGEQFVDCRFEYCHGFAAILVGNGSAKTYTGAFKARDCAFQFTGGACISTIPDNVDDVNKIISGNTTPGVIVIEGSTFERNNNDGWKYTLDDVDRLIGYISVLNGSVSGDAFFSAAEGQTGQCLLLDNCTDLDFGVKYGSSYLESGFLIGTTTATNSLSNIYTINRAETSGAVKFVELNTDGDTFKVNIKNDNEYIAYDFIYSTNTDEMELRKNVLNIYGSYANKYSYKLDPYNKLNRTDPDNADTATPGGHTMDVDNGFITHVGNYAASNRPFTITSNVRSNGDWRANRVVVSSTGLKLSDTISGSSTAHTDPYGTTFTDTVILENDGTFIFPNLPTSDPAVDGQLWNDAGTVKVSAG